MSAATLERPTETEDGGTTPEAGSETPVADPTESAGADVAARDVTITGFVVNGETFPVGNAPETTETTPAGGADQTGTEETPPTRATATYNPAPEGITILGYEVSYSVTGAQIRRDNLIEQLGLAGLAKFAPKKPPTAKAALRRAIAEWASSRSKSGETFAAEVEGENDADKTDVVRRRKLIRETRTKAENGTPGKIVLALVTEESLGEALSLRYALDYRFQLTPPLEVNGVVGGWTLTVSTEARGRINDDEAEAREDERREVDRQIRVSWDKHRDLYIGKDLSELLIEVVHDAQGISVESGTGVWFLPAKCGDLIDRLERFVKRLPVRDGGASTHFRVRENIDWPRTRAALAEAAQDDLLAEIRKFEGELDKKEEQNKEKSGSVRVATMQGLMSELIGVRAKATFYADIVGMRQERIDSELVKLGARAVKIGRANVEARQERQNREVAIAAPVPTPEPQREQRETREERTIVAA